MRSTLSIRRIDGGSADGDDETQRRGVFGISREAPGSSRSIRVDSQRHRGLGGKSQGGGHGRRADPRGDAAFGAGGDAGVGGEAGRSDGTRNSSTTSDASPR